MEVVALTGIFDVGEITDGITRRGGNAGAWRNIFTVLTYLTALLLSVRGGARGGGGGRCSAGFFIQEVERERGGGGWSGGGCITRSICPLME